MNIIMLGKPGSGKGTQSEYLSENLHVPHISFGKLLREFSASDSFIRSGIKEIMATGGLVPDGLVMWLVKDMLTRDDTEAGIIFDGFPRRVGQAKMFEEVMKKLGREITVVFNIQIADETVLERITGRRVCKNDSSHTYHTQYKPSQNDGVCDDCGGDLIQRTDDSDESVKERLDVYDEETKPLLEYYKAQGVLCDIDGERSIEAIALDIKNLTNEMNT